MCNDDNDRETLDPDTRKEFELLLDFVQWRLGLMNTISPERFEQPRIQERYNCWSNLEKALFTMLDTTD